MDNAKKQVETIMANYSGENIILITMMDVGDSYKVNMFAQADGNSTPHAIIAIGEMIGRAIAELGENPIPIAAFISSQLFDSIISGGRETFRGDAHVN